jgi:hypothetical protein
MFRFISSLSILLVLIVSIFVPNLSSAQEQTNVQVTIEDITLASDSFSAGQTYEGTVRATNMFNRDLWNLHLSSSLVKGLNEDFNYIKVINQEIVADFNIKAGETKEIPFSFTIPEYGKNDKNGLYLQVFNHAGETLGITASPITIDGFKDSVGVNGGIMVNDEGYFLQAGPTIYPEDVASISLSLFSTESVKLIPRIKIYNFEITDFVEEKVLEPVVTIANDYTSADFPLERFNEIPGVYFGTVAFENEDGVVVSEQLDFRYIVAGKIATLRDIYADKLSGEKGDTVIVTVKSYGTPFDIINESNPVLGDVQLKAELISSNGKVLGEYEKTINFDANPRGPIVTDIPFVLKADVDSFSVKTTLSDTGGKVYDEALIDFYDYTEESKQEDSSKVWIYVLGLAALISVLGATFIIIKNKNKKYEI